MCVWVCVYERRRETETVKGRETDWQPAWRYRWGRRSRRSRSPAEWWWGTGSPSAWGTHNNAETQGWAIAKTHCVKYPEGGQQRVTTPSTISKWHCFSPNQESEWPFILIGGPRRRHLLVPTVSYTELSEEIVTQRLCLNSECACLEVHNLRSPMSTHCAKYCPNSLNIRAYWRCNLTLRTHFLPISSIHRKTRLD